MYAGMIILECWKILFINCICLICRNLWTE